MVKIFLTDVTTLENTKLFDKVYTSLPASRQQKADSYRNISDKRLSVGASFLLTHALETLRINIADYPILYEKNGKPYLADSVPKVDFSLSHSGKTALCAISDCGRVGCDIQTSYTARMNTAEKTAQRFFTPAENEYIAVSNDKNIAFLRLWTRKESYIKTTGLGFACPLDSFDVSGDKPTIGKYAFYEFADNSYYAAVCSDDTNFDEPQFIVI